MDSPFAMPRYYPIGEEVAPRYALPNAQSVLSEHPIVLMYHILEGHQHLGKVFNC